MRIKLLAFLIALCLPAVSLAQYGTGTLLGTVMDSSGAVVPGVLVIARNAATSETREFRTDAEGNYSFNALPSGTYTITASVQSFKTTTVQDIVLRVNSQTRVEVMMSLGEVSESVQVQSTIPQLQT